MNKQQLNTNELYELIEEQTINFSERLLATFGKTTSNKPDIVTCLTQCFARVVLVNLSAFFDVQKSYLSKAEFLDYCEKIYDNDAGLVQSLGAKNNGTKG